MIWRFFRWLAELRRDWREAAHDRVSAETALRLRLLPRDDWWRFGP